MEVVPQGLRILIQDDKQRDMFQRSSAVLTPFFNRLLAELAPAFNEMDNKIIITGHTDASRYRDQVLYNNWNLSGERALMAHKALVKGGLSEGRVLQINAMADQMLLDPAEPLAAKNRRIEIMVLTKTASDTLYQFFGNHGENVVKPAAKKAG
jgi:chemotaxis protein MotB